MAGAGSSSGLRAQRASKTNLTLDRVLARGPLSAKTIFPSSFALTGVFCRIRPWRYRRWRPRRGDGYNYDLFIVSGEDIPSEAQNRLRGVLGAKENISLRFVLTGNMRGLLPSRPLVRENYTLPTYYRLLLPRLFVNYDKVIYADGDVFFYARRP